MGGPRDPGEHIDSPQPAHIDGAPVVEVEAAPVAEVVEEVLEAENDDGEEGEGT
jgi:hypothetical protein